MTYQDLANVPAYSFAIAARYLKIPVRTLRSWTKPQKRHPYPLIEHYGRDLSFNQLLEAHALKALLIEHQIRREDLRFPILDEAVRDTLEVYLSRVSPDGLTLFPFIHSVAKDDPKAIAINPNIRFGKAYLVETGVPTYALADQYKAGDSVEFLAEDFRCDRALVEMALKFEGVDLRD